MLRDAKDAPLEGLGRIHGFIPSSPLLFNRTVRRPELRKIVPLANTTIYEMEQRGDFPLTLLSGVRNIVWDLAEVEPNWKPTPLPGTTQRPDPGRETQRSAAQI